MHKQQRSASKRAESALSRREVLGSLGALAATAACGAESEPSPQPGTGGTGAAGGTGGASAGSGGTSTSAGNGGSGATGGSSGSTGSGATGGSSGSTGSGATGGSSGSGGSSAGSGGSQAGSSASGSGGENTSGTNAGGTGSGGTANGGTANDGSGGAQAGNAGSGTAGSGGSSGVLDPPPFDDVPSCTMSPTDIAGQGPFFIHELEKDDDISLVRQDIRGRYNEDAEEGVEMQLHLRVLDSTSTACNGTPVPDVDVYIWHTDGQGYYSGFGSKGGAREQTPDVPYGGVPNQSDLLNTDRFCRGVQRTDADGVVSFRSIFPGWYNGRDVHIHVVVLKRDSASRGRVSYSKQNSQNQWIFTTQFYFEPALTKSVHESGQPYLRRTQGSLATYYTEAIKADETNNSGLRAKAKFEDGVVVAQMQLVVNPA